MIIIYFILGIIILIVNYFFESDYSEMDMAQWDMENDMHPIPYEISRSSIFYENNRLLQHVAMQSLLPAYCSRRKSMSMKFHML